MKITETDFSNQILEFVENKLGNIFFFNHLAVVELNEGIHFDINNANIMINDLISYFGKTQPFGVVANRVNSYSVDLLQTPQYREKAKNMCAYTVVGHDHAAKLNAEMESKFCLSEKVDCETIKDAFNYVYEKIVKSNSFTLKVVK